MEWYETIELYTTTERNNADTFNTRLEKVLANTKYNKNIIDYLNNTVYNLGQTLQNDYTKTEDLNTLLENGVKGDKGDTGIGLNYNWSGTSLGVKREDETDYTYVDLKGDKGEDGTGAVSKTSELINDSGFITSNDIPTSLPASDVYDWAKAETKPSYTPTEVGALARGATAVCAVKVSQYLTLQIGGSTVGKFNGHSAVTYNVPEASTETSGVMTASQVTSLNTAISDISDLKTTSVNGKTTVANAINGVLGTSLSSTTSYDDYALYIGRTVDASKGNLSIYHSQESTNTAVVGNSYTTKAMHCYGTAPVTFTLNETVGALNVLCDSSTGNLTLSYRTRNANSEYTISGGNIVIFEKSVTVTPTAIYGDAQLKL